jgi:hypothetical protein
MCNLAAAAGFVLAHDAIAYMFKTVLTRQWQDDKWHLYCCQFYDMHVYSNINNIFNQSGFLFQKENVLCCHVCKYSK